MGIEATSVHGVQLPDFTGIGRRADLRAARDDLIESIERWLGANGCVGLVE